MAKNEIDNDALQDLFGGLVNRVQDGLSSVVKTILKQDDLNRVSRDTDKETLTDEQRATLEQVLRDVQENRNVSISEIVKRFQDDSEKEEELRREQERKANLERLLAEHQLDSQEDFDLDVVLTGDSQDSSYSLICKGYNGGDAEVVIPEGIVSIGDFAFEGKEAIKRVFLPKTLKRIGGGAFKGCTSLESISFEKGVKIIEADAFSGCTSLKSAHLPSLLTYLGEGVFSGCTSLETVTLSPKLDGLPDLLFSGCTSLKTVVNIRRPSDVFTYGMGVFSDVCRNDKWEYFEYNSDDDSCVRVEGDLDDIEPEECDDLFETYPSTKIARQYLHFVLNWIWTSSPFDRSIIKYRMEILKSCMLFVKLLTDSDEYQALNVLNTVYNMLLQNMDKKQTYLEEDIYSALFYVFETIEGSILRSTDEFLLNAVTQMYDLDITESFTLNDLKKRLDPDLFGGMKLSLDIEEDEAVPDDRRNEVIYELKKYFYGELIKSTFDSNRNHPLISKYAARHDMDDDYVSFMIEMEGLIRGQKLNLNNYNDILCDVNLNDHSRQWMLDWSGRLAKDNYGIFVFELSDGVDSLIEGGIGNDGDITSSAILALYTKEKARQVYEFMDKYQCASSLRYIYDQKDLFKKADSSENIDGDDDA